MTHEATTEPELELASQGRRLAGFILDIPLFAITFGIGWLIWYLIRAQQGQSPAKQLLGIRVVREDGTAAGLGWMLLRDLVIRGIGFSVLNLLITLIDWDLAFVTSILFALAALWCVWDANRQCLWDKAVGTYVVRGQDAAGTPAEASPRQEAAENLQTLEDLHARGLLTDEEYEERRAREMERL